VMSDWWDRWGPTVLAEPRQSLAALLGHAGSERALAAAGLRPLRLGEIAQERAFDPNPYRLKLSEEYLRTKLLIRSLTLWGWEPLARAAVACADLQREWQSECEAPLLGLRDAAWVAATEFLAAADAAHRQRAERAASPCRLAYKPFEQDQDSPVAARVWYQLGAPWCAAETAAADTSLTPWDGPGPVAASASWGNRNSVWPVRAADAAAHWSSYPEVQDRIRIALLAWTIGEEA
jgi:hypothetical protein